MPAHNSTAITDPGASPHCARRAQRTTPGATVGLMLAMVLVGAISSGCLDEPGVVCADGRICPDSQVCDDVHQGCVSPGQLTACDGLNELDPCLIAGEPLGICRDGVCLYSICGDGIRHGLEQCDGDDLGDFADCTEIGYSNPGPLRCSPACVYDRNLCSGICGDGEVSGTESCETAQALTKTCLDFGFYEPDGLSCSLACTVDVTACRGFCGDGVVNGGELCDGLPPTAPTCIALGFDAGAPGCTNYCRMDEANCASLGFKPEPTGTSEFFWGVTASPTGTLFAVGTGGTIMRRLDGEWSAMDSQTTELLRSVWAVSDTFAVAVGDKGTIRVLNGTTWNIVESGTTLHLTDVWAIDANNVFVVGDGGTVIFYDGATWTLQSLTTRDLRTVWGTSATNVWTAGLFKTIFHFDGATWTLVTPGIGRDYQSMWGSSADNIWAVATFGEIDHFDGTNWTQYPSPTTTWLRDVHGSGPRDVFAVGEQGTIYHYDGISWNKLKSSTNFELRGVVSFDGNVWAVGNGGTITHARNAYELEDAPGTETLAIGGLDTDHLIAVGANGYAREWNGASWNTLNVGGLANQPLEGVWEVDKDHFIVVGGGGQILQGLGSNWSKPASGVTTTLRDVWSAHPGAIYAVGDGGVILRNNGTTWSLEPTPVTANLRGVWGASDDRVFAVGDGGVMLERVAGMWSTVTTGSTHRLEALSGSSAADIWAVGWEGTILHFDGTAWTASASDTFQSFNDVMSNGPADVLAVGAQGEVRHFDGLAWRPVQMPASNYQAVWTSGQHWVIAGSLASTHLIRRAQWHCPESGGERSCGDNSDNDCDGERDGEDPDCISAAAFSEIHLGSDVAYVEIAPRGPGHTSLEGLVIASYAACDAAIKTHALPRGAGIDATTVWRAVDRAPTWTARESGGTGLCGTPTTSMWLALCAGPCDFDSCANVLDYVELGGAQPLPPRPSCTSFTGGAVNVQSVGATQSVTRSANTGAGAAGNAADWIIAARTRD